MASGWRIVRRSRVEAAFTGEGPWRYGARWNSPGIRVIYASEHQSTATLEVFANRTPFIPDERYEAFHLEWADDLMEIFPLQQLPANWRVHPPSVETREIGNRWIRERRSAVLILPSAVSPADRNFLLNPDHPDFKRIRIAPPIDFEFDPRLHGR
jgi:RES domain-containing protein